MVAILFLFFRPNQHRITATISTQKGDVPAENLIANLMASWNISQFKPPIRQH
jgi:hypothetical protein